MTKRLWFACIFAIPVAPAQTTYSETILHSFANTHAPKGAEPSTGILRDAAGNIYGATSGGGSWDVGVVYKLDASGQETVLHALGGRAQGVHPIGNMFRDEAGNIYGSTLFGGNLTGVCSQNGGCGVVFKIDTTGRETVLHTFTGGNDGAYPYSGVIRDAAGNLYGTTAFGGTKDMGVVFKLDSAGNEMVLHNFAGGADGSYPDTPVLLDSGNLYGTTECGGTGSLQGCSVGAGTVFKLDAAGDESVLYNFTGGADGGYPQAGVIRDSAGNLYGTTYLGGAANAGAVYMLNPAGQLTVLHGFAGGSDGASPEGGLFRDPAGNLYGTTYSGGKGRGVLYKVDAAGTYTVLHRFTGGADGENPSAGVIPGSSGNLYGVTQHGGEANQGVIYKVDASGQVTVPYSFLAKTDGTYPEAGVALDSAGNLYGTTSQGGLVYKVDARGQYSILYTFSNAYYGLGPEGSLTLDSTGNLYGTADVGGAAQAGTVYKLDPAGQVALLYSFTGGADGANPQAGVTFDSAGNLYGTTNLGGSAGLGVVYKLSPDGQETVLHTFTGEPDGAKPTAAVTLDAAGNLYGTAYQGGEGHCYPQSGCGVVYEIDTAGNYTILYTFTGGADGGGPFSGVILDAAGNLYGTTYQGSLGFGVVYKLDTSGHQSALYTFTGLADGGNPIGGLLLDATGNLYGTTANAGSPVGSYGNGVVFELDAGGTYTVLHTFAGPPDGSTPWGGVIMDPAGNLYGTTYKGGKLTSGVVFKLSPHNLTEGGIKPVRVLY